MTGGTASVLDNSSKVNSHGLGLSLTQLELAVKKVARAWSESGADINMYYAGQRTNNTPVEGIIIQSNDQTDAEANSSGGGTGVSAGITGGRVNLHPKFTGSLEWIITPKGSEPVYVRNIVTDLMHETGHALGLDAHPKSTAHCPSDNITNEPGWCSDSNIGLPIPVCVGTAASVLSLFREQPTADDILGMQFRYGVRSNQVLGYRSTSASPGTWTGVAIPVSVDTTAPPAISPIGTDQGVNVGSVIAFTNSANTLFITRDSGAGYGTPERVGGATADKKTFIKPAVAVGGGKIVVAYAAMTDLSCDQFFYDYCVKTISSGAWTCTSKTCSSPPLSVDSGHVGVAYDAVSNAFIVTEGTSSKRLEGGRINLSNFNTDSRTEFHLLPPTSNYSKSACQPKLNSFSQSECYAASSHGTSYRARIFQYSIDATGAFVVAGSTIKLFGDVTGYLDLAVGDGNVFLVAVNTDGNLSTIHKFVALGGTPTSSENWLNSQSPLAVGGVRVWTTTFPQSSSTEFRVVNAPN